MGVESPALESSALRKDLGPVSRVAGGVLIWFRSQNWIWSLR